VKLVLGMKLYLQPTSRSLPPLASNADSGSESLFQLAFRIPGVCIRSGGSGCLGRTVRGLDPPLDVANAQLLFHDFLRDRDLSVGSIESEQRTRVTRRQLVLGDEPAYLPREAKETKKVRDRGSILADARRHLLLRIPKLRDEPGLPPLRSG
jgi:hypothetical protein